MVDEIEEQEIGQFNPKRYLDAVRRRHVAFLVAVFLGWLAVWGGSWFLPVRYKSGTLILVEAPTMPKDYVTPNVSDNLQDRLQSISQQILSRTRLLSIIDELQLYTGHQALTPDEKIEKMRKDIDIELVRDPRAQITAFNVFYYAPDPHVAQRVTSKLTTLFIQENLRVRAQQSANTTGFITSQLDSARAALADQEEKVRAYQSSHIGELPTQQASNLQILSGLQSQLQNEEEALNAARQQGVYHQTLIHQYRALQGTSQKGLGSPAGLPAIDQQLDNLRTKLADVGTRYTDSHPEVRELKAEIVKTERMKEELISSLNNQAASKDHEDDTQLADAAAPAENSVLLQLQSQLRANQVEVGNREQAIAALKARINQYQDRLNRSPAIEQQLAALTRGYEQSQQNYNDLLKKKNDSQMATSMEQMQQGERFTMLDPPSLPVRPDSPKRMKLCGMAVGAGIGLGVLIVVLLEMIDGRMHGEEEIKKLLPVKVVSEIPEILTEAGEKSKKRRVAFAWSLATIVVVLILAGSTLSYLHA